MLKPSRAPLSESLSHETDALASGLCMNCREAATCMYLRQRGGAVWHCDEYGEGRDEPMASIIETPRPTLTEPKGLQGLCSNCDARATCTLPRPVGGVWHCEEYV
jgi:hypothetical protein